MFYDHYLSLLSKLIHFFFKIIITEIGTIIAALGKGTDSGDFEVEEYIFPGFSPQKPFPQGKNKGKYVLFVSGLNIGKDDVNPLHFKLLVGIITSIFFLSLSFKINSCFCFFLLFLLLVLLVFSWSNFFLRIYYWKYWK